MDKFTINSVKEYLHKQIQITRARENNAEKDYLNRYFNGARCAYEDIARKLTSPPKQLIAYICSPYKGDIERNTAYAKELTLDAIQAGYIPVTPHLYLPQVLNDNITEHRKLGLTIGLQLLEICDVIIVGNKHGVSEGMQSEITRAMELEIRVLVTHNYPVPYLQER